MQTIYKIAIIALIIVLLIVVGFFFYPRFSTTLTNVNPFQPPSILSVIGEVQEKDVNGFRLKASKEQNTLAEDKVFSVIINSQTIFSGIILPEAISQEDIHKPIPAKTLSFADLQVGDQVAVASAIDIRNQTEFIAVSVQISKSTQ